MMPMEYADVTLEAWQSCEISVAEGDEGKNYKGAKEEEK